MRYPQLCVLSLAGLLIACGPENNLPVGINGGGGGEGDDYSGQFIDGLVENIRFRCGKLSTVYYLTNAQGEYSCTKSPGVTLSLGELDLGTTIDPSIKRLTPVDLVNNAMDETHTAVTNIAYLIQKFADNDTNACNGINGDPAGHIIIPDQVHAVGTDLSPDLNNDTEVDAALNTLSTRLNALCGTPIALQPIGRNDAQINLNAALLNLTAGGYIGNYFAVPNTSELSTSLPEVTATHSGSYQMIVDRSGNIIGSGAYFDIDPQAPGPLPTLLERAARFGYAPTTANTQRQVSLYQPAGLRNPELGWAITLPRRTLTTDSDARDRGSWSILGGTAQLTETIANGLSTLR